MTTISTKIVKAITEKYQKEHKQNIDPQLIKEVIEATLHEAMEINNQFNGRKLGEIDLNMVYKEEFGIKDKKDKNFSL